MNDEQLTMNDVGCVYQQTIIILQ